MTPDLLHRAEDGSSLPYLVWRWSEPVRMISSAVHGGGIAEATWVLNAQVPAGYHRLDPAAHLDELAAQAGLSPDRAGVGMLTAADVAGWQSAADGGVRVDATVGVRVPTWAAAPDGADSDLAGAGANLAAGPGTINIVAVVPAAMSDGALVNLVATATEAKAQALLDLGVPGTGTATDAVCIVTDAHPDLGLELDPFGGPRSRWGSRLARAVHAAVSAGTVDSLGRVGLR